MSKWMDFRGAWVSWGRTEAGFSGSQQGTESFLVVCCLEGQSLPGYILAPFLKFIILPSIAAVHF